MQQHPPTFPPYWFSVLLAPQLWCWSTRPPIPKLLMNNFASLVVLTGWRNATGHSLSPIYTSNFSLTSPLVKENLLTVHTSKFSLTSFPWQVFLGSVNEKYDKFSLSHFPCCPSTRANFRLDNFSLSRKSWHARFSLTRKICPLFPIYTSKFSLSRKTCQGKIARVNGALTTGVGSGHENYNSSTWKTITAMKTAFFWFTLVFLATLNLLWEVSTNDGSCGSLFETHFGK